jgi:sugar phosphate isomerase/epimerase
MFTLAAFADEIDPDPRRQVEVLTACGVRFIELRSVNGVNVLDLTDAQVADFQHDIAKHGIGVSTIGSPIGKAAIDEPFETQLQKLDRAIELAKRFGTQNIRIFSFYPAGDAEPTAWRSEVIARLTEMAARAADADIRLLHENEHRIFGDSAARCVELLDSVNHLALRAAFDPANFVVCGHDPWDAWTRLRDRVVHLHVKDWVAGEGHGRVAGQGHGRLRDILADAAARGYDGFATLEPHLLGGGPTGGHTGPDLFPHAVQALRDLLQSVGGRERGA